MALSANSVNLPKDIAQGRPSRYTFTPFGGGQLPAAGPQNHPDRRRVRMRQGPRRLAPAVGFARPRLTAHPDNVAALTPEVKPHRKCQAPGPGTLLANEFFLLPGRWRTWEAMTLDAETTPMPNLTIQCHLTSSNPCTLCGKTPKPTTGPRLFLADSGEVVCRECGKRHAPALVALLDLAAVAEHVGRIGRHTLVPPMGALLELARAAEQYADCKPRLGRQAA